MRIIPLAVLVAASPAAAQPILQPTACTVSVARAPDDVRVVIEQWIARETRCSSILEVRVVVTEGGYYLVARDEHGRLRDRIVPDAQSAGLLVASWSADDALPPPRTPFDERSPLRSRGSEAEPQLEELVPPGAAPALTTTAMPSRARDARWLGLAGLVGMQDGGGRGVRAELDLRTWGPWALGLAASYSESHLGMDWDTMDVFDTKAMASLSYTVQGGRWNLRATAGAGAVYTRADATVFTGMSDESYTASGAFLTAEASLTMARELGESWAIAAGPILSLYGQSYTVVVNDPVWGPEPHSLDRREIDVMLLVGLRHRL